MTAMIRHGHEKVVRWGMGSQYHCNDCGATWDVDDAGPPECKTLAKASARKAPVAAYYGANVTYGKPRPRRHKRP